jgi:hypothetical protein
MKILSPRAHGYIDFLVVIGFVGGPAVFELEGLPVKIAHCLALVHLLLTSLTNFPMGLIKLIPFPLHGLLEFAVAIVLFALPWVAGFSGDESARYFYVGAGACVLLAFLITDYTAGRGR